ncbi:MAG: preprotein translocase subunit SecE [Polyangiaceae bacterium]|nr:preprotein translocase subunit SecE [Polyangiaceae bacterium]MBK8943411.1 preprotein translocase subunit SecE [Polyangiaceae bacterium]
MLGGFILGRALETLWERVAVSDWAVRNIPAVTGVPDESKATYSFIAAGVVAVIVGVYNFRKAHVRRWAEDVSTELLKVKWPTRKEVYASTVVVLATSAVAVVYLFLLDRFWGFLTDKIYGMGS